MAILECQSGKQGPKPETQAQPTAEPVPASPAATLVSTLKVVRLRPVSGLADLNAIPSRRATVEHGLTHGLRSVTVAGAALASHQIPDYPQKAGAPRSGAYYRRDWQTEQLAAGIAGGSSVHWGWQAGCAVEWVGQASVRRFDSVSSDSG